MPKGQYTRKIRPVIVPVGPSIAYVELTQGQFALIDSEDAEYVGKRNWHAHWAKNTKTFYAGTNIDGKSVEMQRYLLRLSEEMLGDHKNRNTLDNRRCNLRPATLSQNGRNSAVRKSKSGCKGVEPLVNGNWKAVFTEGSRKVILGHFPTISEADACVKSHRIAVLGEFA